MREIKFRAWNGIQMLYPINFKCDSGYLAVPWGIDCWGQFCSLVKFEPKKYNEKIDVVIMQYTGLKDKNGKEIYEGDIVKYRETITNPNHPKYLEDYYDKNVVEFIDGKFYPVASFSIVEIEVIGNIHENPELLED